MTHKAAGTAFNALFLASALLLTTQQESHGFAEVARGNLTLDLQGRVIYDSNVEGNATGVSDTLYSIRPTLRFARDAGRSPIDAWLGFDFSRFQDSGDLDFTDYDSGITIDVPTAQGSRFSGDFSAEYSQDSGSDQSLLRRVQIKRTRFDFNGNYLIGAKTSIRFGAGYRYEDPEDFSTTTYYDGTLGVQYELRSINSIFLDYRRRRSESDGGVDNVSNTVFFGVSRPIGGRVHGSASIGYENTDARGVEVSNPDRLILRANISWKPRQTSTVGLSVGRDLDIAGFDESFYNTYLEINGSQRLSHRFNATGRARRRWYDYQGGGDRSDRVLELSVGINYSFNSQFTAGVEYEYRKSSSNSVVVLPDPIGTVGLADYSRNRVSLFLSYEF